MDPLISSCWCVMESQKARLDRRFQTPRILLEARQGRWRSNLIQIMVLQTDPPLAELFWLVKKDNHTQTGTLRHTTERGVLRNGIKK